MEQPIKVMNKEEKTLVEVKISQVNESGKFRSRVITEVAPLSDFYDAEDYHQDYYKKSSLRYKLYKK